MAHNTYTQPVARCAVPPYRNCDTTRRYGRRGTKDGAHVWSSHLLASDPPNECG
uniref:Uncharacterized protein n=1 Tax=Ascaris lumbricoides TaxID=6252 RepID=A0A0M3HSY3_ASCLU